MLSRIVKPSTARRFVRPASTSISDSLSKAKAAYESVRFYFKSVQTFFYFSTITKLQMWKKCIWRSFQHVFYLFQRSNVKKIAKLQNKAKVDAPMADALKSSKVVLFMEGTVRWLFSQFLSDFIDAKTHQNNVFSHHFDFFQSFQFSKIEVDHPKSELSLNVVKMLTEAQVVPYSYFNFNFFTKRSRRID